MNNYPDGAEHDPRAPWNQKGTNKCDECGNEADDELIEAYSASRGENAFFCVRCAGREKCDRCKKWYHADDVNSYSICVDCDPDAIEN
jgi:hypothetical protein